jgi:hypothetical protein
LVAKARADSASAENELAALARAQQPSRANLPPLEQVLTAAGDWASVLRGADIEAQREVLVILVDRIVATRESRDVYRLEVSWTSLGEALRERTAD